MSGYMGINAKFRSDEKYFSQGDYTTNNLRVGERLDQLFPLDFELARLTGNPLEDAVMFSVFALGTREDDAVDLKESFKELLPLRFQLAFNNLAHEKNYDIKLDDKYISKMNFIEELRANLYKIGDQIWTQERDGASEERVRKAKWHYTQMMINVVERSAIEEHDGEGLYFSFANIVADVLYQSKRTKFLHSFIHDMV
ncbi:hypothetical protein ACFL1H_07400 [Nanoarchaeota archaeon]